MFVSTSGTITQITDTATGGHPVVVASTSWAFVIPIASWTVAPTLGDAWMFNGLTNRVYFSPPYTGVNAAAGTILA